MLVAASFFSYSHVGEAVVLGNYPQRWITDTMLQQPEADFLIEW